jgi:hypothetical protein
MVPDAAFCAPQWHDCGPLQRHMCVFYLHICLPEISRILCVAGTVARVGLVMGYKVCSVESDETQFRNQKTTYGRNLQRLVKYTHASLVAAHKYHTMVTQGLQCTARSFPFSDGSEVGLCVFCAKSPDSDSEDDDDTHHGSGSAQGEPVGDGELQDEEHADGTDAVAGDYLRRMHLPSVSSYQLVVGADAVVEEVLAGEGNAGAESDAQDGGVVRQIPFNEEGEADVNLGDLRNTDLVLKKIVSVQDFISALRLLKSTF